MNFKEVIKEEFEQLYVIDLVTQPNGITFENNRYSHHVLGTRSRKVLGKVVTDMWMIEPTKYYLTIGA